MKMHGQNHIKFLKHICIRRDLFGIVTLMHGYEKQDEVENP